MFSQPLTVAHDKTVSFWACNISILPQPHSSSQLGVLIHQCKRPPRQNQYILETAVFISLKWTPRISLKICLQEEEKFEFYEDSQRENFQPEKEVLPWGKVYNWHKTLQGDLELRQWWVGPRPVSLLNCANLSPSVWILPTFQTWWTKDE